MVSRPFVLTRARGARLFCRRGPGFTHFAPRRLFHLGLPVGNAALLEEELHELGRLIGHDAARDLEGVVGVLGTRKTAHAALEDGTEPR